MRISRQLRNRALCAAVALVAPLGPSAVIGSPAAAAQPCVNGVVPLNPYVVNCNLGQRPPKIRGSAPDAGAIIACRHDPVCLSYYVNNP